jgi:hypothetical protein
MVRFSNGHFPGHFLSPVFEWLKQNGGQTIQKPDEFVQFWNAKWPKQHSKTGKICPVFEWS